MMLYDVYYHDSAFDSNTQLPAPTPDIERAVNTNWDRHELLPVTMADGSMEWTSGCVVRNLYASPGVMSVSPEGQDGTRQALSAMRLISHTRSWGWGHVATVTMRAEDERANSAALAEGWDLRKVK
jgi:hypothetical protein